MSITFVSCYYPVKNKHNHEAFQTWFQNTLAIDVPYVFFIPRDPTVRSLIQQFRGTRPTVFIEYDIHEFYSYQYRTNMIVHPVHCPSVELNLIWNEKIFMIEKAATLNPFNSEWFHFIDAGICVYRTTVPSPIPPSGISPEKFKSLPTDKFIYSQSQPYSPKHVTNKIYYHHVSGTFLLHKSIIPTIIDRYKQYLSRITRTTVWTEQVLLTHIYRDFPDLFYKLCDGYGTISTFLVENN